MGVRWDGQLGHATARRKASVASTNNRGGWRLCAGVGSDSAHPSAEPRAATTALPSVARGFPLGVRGYGGGWGLGGMVS